MTKKLEAIPIHDFEIHDIAEVNLTGGTLIECFPSTSSLALIVANIILEAGGKPEHLNYEQIAVGDSDRLPSVCMINFNRPKFPIQIYAHKDPNTKIALLVSEIPQDAPITREIGRKIFRWVKEKEISQIISIEGFISEETHSPQQQLLKIYGVGTTDSCKSILDSKEIAPLNHGVIKGLSAALLKEGVLNKSEVIVLLGEVRQHYPEIRTAARIVDVLNQLIPSLGVDTEPILAQAEKIEQLALSMRDQASAAVDDEKNDYNPNNLKEKMNREMKEAFSRIRKGWEEEKK